MADNRIVTLTVVNSVKGWPPGLESSIKESRLFVQPPVSNLKLPTVLRLGVRLDTVPTSSRGIVFGSDKRLCDVVLPEHPKISDRHFSLTFDSQSRLVVVDHSTNGTEVIYNGNGTGIRTKTQWILNDPAIPADFRNNIKIHVGKLITFSVDVRLMMSQEPTYTRVVERFKAHLSSCDDFEESMREIRLRQTSGWVDPASDALWVRWQAAKGGSSLLYTYWYPRDGSMKCMKEPATPSEEAVERWSHENEILKQCDHHHIVKWLSYMPPSGNRLSEIYMEYLGGGTLQNPENLSPFSRQDVTSILGQCLSALVHLHSMDPPICHRDIKPANVVINRRTESDICVKIADFGEAKIESKTNFESSEDLLVGDTVYSAPEVFEYTSKSSSKGICKRSLDVFSLGLTALGMIEPKLPKMYGPQQKEFFKELDRSGDHMVQFLREHMLIENEAARSSASECLDHLQRLPEVGGPIACGCDCEPCKEFVFHGDHKEKVDGVSPSTSGQALSSNSPTPTPSVKEALEMESLEHEVQSPGQTTPVQVPGAHLDTDQISPTSGGDLTPICDVPLESLPTTDTSQEASPEGDASTAEKTPHQGVKRPAESDSEGSQVNKRVRSKSPETPFGEQM